MPSFARLLHIMEQEEDLLDSGEETPAMQVIRKGLDINENFWSDFMSILGNKEGISDLFGVDPTNVSGWHSSIQKTLDKVKNKESKSVISTGSI